MSLALATTWSAKPATASKSSSKLSGEVFATLINLSGRRRFTSQRVVLYAVLASKNDPAALDVARDALRLFTDAHATLIKGNEVLPGVFSPALQEAYFGLEHGDRKISEFIALADRTLHAIESGWRQVPTLLDELVASTTPLLAILNSITAIYEKEARSHASKVKNQLKDVMSEIKAISKHAHLVAFNAQIIAARAGNAGREFSVVAGVLTGITGEIDKLVQAALVESGA
ncbi:MAG TPA: type IV pili methyl-accepting chemotaxis transducer N-terminal domain-containing protein [Burkholderiaceae bacterium]|nr:type IV pili methyl-accepting chemotaxis transducer N-terminal domain-containing protein [Burkholderiaceae bacterium]